MFTISFTSWLIKTYFKDATSVSFRSELFTSYILILFKQENLLPSIWETAKYSYPCMQKYNRKNEFVENVWPANLALLFTFRPIASKQLNSLTTIDPLSWLCCAVVTHPLWVQEVPGSIPGSDKDFYVSFFALLLLWFYFFCQKHIICHKSLQFLLQC